MSHNECNDADWQEITLNRRTSYSKTNMNGVAIAAEPYSVIPKSGFRGLSEGRSPLGSILNP
uniref:Uncharacterized protein n=1 Tax=Parascaris equorum TaxID=6256 RepID=A0A914R2D6_PAREQ